jgi:DNA-directed RNA polymerase specialized sigma24 family protein
VQDADAFAALYDREARDVLVFIARRTLDPELALDLAAETFAQAFRGRRSFRGSSVAEERAWLFTIARRQISRYHRRGTVERRALQVLGASVPQATDGDLREIEEAAARGGAPGREQAHVDLLSTQIQPSVQHEDGPPRARSSVTH